MGTQAMGINEREEVEEGVGMGVGILVEGNPSGWMAEVEIVEVLEAVGSG